ncbi:hypothetical protein ASG95_15385 [Phycicoccus sp. Soil803]|nr:hypothetical protein ASG95_15385 [Phycicoccus sp. Soil803]
MVVRLKEAGVCACGQVVAAGERAGSTRQSGLVVCLSCVAAFSTAPDEDILSVYYEAPAPGQDADLSVSLPEPVSVVIPADWGPSTPSKLPAWQRSAGITVDLPPAAPVGPGRVEPAVPPVVVQFAPPSPVEEDALRAAEVESPVPTPVPAAPAAPVAETPPPASAAETPPPAPAAETPPSAPVAETAPVAPAPPVDAAAAEAPEPATSVIAVSHEAVAIVGPSHRRRTFLPAGLLALRASRGRDPGVTGTPDGATRAILDAAADAGVLSLHDRHMPGRRGRIAHLAVGAGGVYVIDVVRAKNASVEVRPADEPAPVARELLVGGRPMTSTVTATQGRVEIVRALLDEVGLSAVPVVGVMCFVDAAVPTDADLEVDGVQVTGKTGLPALVRSEGALEGDHLETLAEYLAERLPA